MKKIGFTKNGVIVLAGDLFLVFSSLYLSYLLRFDFHIPSNHIHTFDRIILFMILVKLSAFYLFGLYKGMWRYTSIPELVNIIKASFAGSLIVVGTLFFVNRLHGFSRSVFLMDLFFTVLFISGFRIAIRIYFEYAVGESIPGIMGMVFSNLFGRKKGDGKKALIIGAGDCGEKIYREICNNTAIGLNVVGFLDDNPVKIGRKIHGVPIIGPISIVDRVVSRLDIDEIIIAIPTATEQQMRTIVSHCRKSGVPFRVVPGFDELINGTPSVASLRKVAYRDLLGRKVVSLDRNKIGSYLHEKTVLVTGAGGSIGSELCRQLCSFEPQSIVLLERAESSLYDIDLELKEKCKGKSLRIIPVLADIQNMSQLEQVFRETGPQVVFHAAAYKHVPMMEEQPWEAVKNNILGTRNLVEAAKRFSVERFVLVSTDKAVRPANVMGATKRVAELLLQDGNNADKSQTQFMAVRFGNVLGSVGSVVPLFQKQIKKGGPVTVTHPEITRFFMTISEACQLILQAGAIGNNNGGKAAVFVLRMGRPVKIVDIARDLIRLSGFEPEKDIPIEFIGLRPGEKLYEELVTEGEKVVPTGHDKILVIHGQAADHFPLKDAIEELERLSKIRDADAIKAYLKMLVPEYTPFLRN
ncbi:MAG: capsule biosynthesis protein CapD [Desulfococcus sp. 4484_241]|nr:MAG: capsule biosynthesis protein CapD [Desulfococcus sp. 4484_241]